MKKPLISVIMPFYNCVDYLDESIQSILNQTFSDFEFIIINDASTDDSDTKIQQYLQDTRIIYKKNEINQGIVDNLNYGLSIAQGEYIARMDGDDISTLDRFEMQINFLTKNKDISIVSGQIEIIDSQSKITGLINKPIDTNIIYSDLFSYLTLIHGASMIKHIVYKDVGGYRKEYLYTEDNDRTQRAILFGGYKGVNLDHIIYKYRKHQNSCDKRAGLIARLNMQLRREAISKGYKPSIKEYMIMYGDYILGTLFSGKQKIRIEKFIKKLLIK